MSDIAKTITRRLSALKSLRQPHETTWQECYDWTYPERGNGLNSSIFDASASQQKKNRILDGTAADSVRTLASGLVSGTTPANSIWFGLDMGNEDEGDDTEMDDEDRWLDSSARFIFRNIHAANFDSAAYECCTDIVCAGWFVLYVDEAKEGGYTFEQWPISQCFVSASKPGQPIDTVYREVSMTIEQVVTEYGIDSVSHQVAEAYRNDKLDDQVKIIHAIYPRQVHAVGAKMAKNLPFASFHVEQSTNHVIRESGYHEFPCVVPRWMLITGSAYATGPMSQALGDTRTLNDIKALQLAALDIAVSGMWIAEDDGVLNPRSIKLGARKIVVANSVDSMKPLQSGSDFNVSFSTEERLQASTRKTLLADQLQAQDGPAMTATEVHVRVQLIRQLLGPIYGRLQAEYLQPLITRCFGLAYRAGVLGMAPKSLQGRQFTVKYISPLARAQKLEEVSAIDQHIAGAINVSQVHPEVLDTIDFDAAQQVRGKALGVPAVVMRHQKDIDATRKARTEQQQKMQQQAANQEMMSKAVPAMASGMVKNG